MRRNFTKKTTGFSLIELLIVIGITTILAGVSAVVYGNLQVSAQLNDVSAQLTQSLRLAREQSLAGLNNIDHGVKIDSNQYTLYQGASYNIRESSYDRVFPLASALTLTLDLTPAGSDIIFYNGIGSPSATGTITVSHSVTGTKTIIINNLGVIQEQ